MHACNLPPFAPLSLSAEKIDIPCNLTPLDIFTPLSNKPWAIWLDSGESTHIDACFDIITWNPEATISTEGLKTSVHLTQSNTTLTDQADPLIIIDIVNKYLIAPAKSSKYSLPFFGGALGYFSYDLGRRFEKLPIIAKHDIKLPEMAVGIYSQAIIYDHKQKEYYLVCPNEKRTAIERELLSILSVNPTTISKTKNFELTTDWQSNMDIEAYNKKFKQVQNYLLSGDCYQINLAQRFQAKYQGDEFQAYCALRTKNKAPFSAFMQFAGSNILSVSPERFLQCKKGKVQSKPIKGTMPRSDNKIQDKLNANLLAKSIKDRAENLMIVDLLRNDISKVCKPNSVVVPTLFDIESFPAVHHLVSTVEGEISNKFTASDLLRGAFPGGSITGAPKIRAMEIIEQLEPHRRSVYCGSIGYISNCGNMDTNIVIRTIVCDTINNTLYCWAGGGLVADSIAENEFQETYDKVNCILPILEKLGK